MKRDNATPLLDVTEWDIEDIGSCFRYVNHKRELATTGWPLREDLEKNASGFLATNYALSLCRERYEKLYNGRD